MRSPSRCALVALNAHANKSRQVRKSCFTLTLSALPLNTVSFKDPRVLEASWNFPGRASQVHLPPRHGLCVFYAVNVARNDLVVFDRKKRKGPRQVVIHTFSQSSQEGVYESRAEMVRCANKKRLISYIMKSTFSLEVNSCFFRFGHVIYPPPPTPTKLLLKITRFPETVKTFY